MAGMVQGDSSSGRLPGTAVGVIEDNDGFGQIESLILSCPRPFVLVSEREVSVLRRGLTKDGWKRILYLQPAGAADGLYVGAGLLSTANQSLEMDASIPPPAGDYGLFHCECGSRLDAPADLVVAEHYTCPACGKTASGEDYDGAVRFLQHQRLARAALALALVYSIEKDRAYADKAVEILTNYAAAYAPRVGESDGGMMYCIRDEAAWSIALAQAYDLIYYSRSFIDEQREVIEAKLFRQVAEGLMSADVEGAAMAWCTSAVGVVGLAIKDAALVRHALGSFMGQMTGGVSGDGWAFQTTQADHFSTLSAFVHFAEGCYRAGIDLYNWEPRGEQSLKSMFATPLQYMYPSFRLPAINDGPYDSFLPVHLYEIAYRRWDDQAFAWVLKRGYKFGDQPLNADQRDHLALFARSSFYAFLFGRDLPGRLRAPMLASTDLPSFGVCTLRSSDEVMATLRHGPSVERGHLDKLSFTLYAGDELLAADYGAPGRGTAMAGWHGGTAAHNAVVVDGRSQAPSSAGGLVARYSGTFLHYAEAVANDCYPGVSQTRRIILVGNACFVSDELSSGAEHDYDWLARCEGTPARVGTSPSVDLDVSSYPMFTIEESFAVDGLLRIDWQCENADLAFAMWTSGASATAALGTSPAETANQRVPLVMCRLHGREARFTAVFASGDRPQLAFEDGAFSVIRGEEADHVYLASAGVAGGWLQTDAQVAAVRTRGDDVVAVALIGGTFVKWLGEMLLECPARVDCVEVYFGDRYPTIKYCSDIAGMLRLRTRARAMRLNGHKTAATTTDGQALLRVMPQMLGPESLELKS